MKEITDAMRDASEVVEAGVSKLEDENAALRAEIAKLKQPPVVDGKTPGQVAMAAYYAKVECGSRIRDWWEAAAAAVLAAFGQQQPAPVAFTDADVEREAKRLFGVYKIDAGCPTSWANLFSEGVCNGFRALARESLERATVQPAHAGPCECRKVLEAYADGKLSWGDKLDRMGISRSEHAGSLFIDVVREWLAAHPACEPVQPAPCAVCERVREAVNA